MTLHFREAEMLGLIVAMYRRRLPIDVDEVSEHFRITETQWRDAAVRT